MPREISPITHTASIAFLENNVTIKCAYKCNKFIQKLTTVDGDPKGNWWLKMRQNSRKNHPHH
jgi:hypothetical protein